MADDGTISNPNVGSPADRQTGKKKENRGGWQGGLKAAGGALQSTGRDLMEAGAENRITPVAYKRGGKVRRTGPAIVHKGERVIPAGKRKKVERLMKKSKMRMRARS